MKNELEIVDPKKLLLVVNCFKPTYFPSLTRFLLPHLRDLQKKAGSIFTFDMYLLDKKLGIDIAGMVANAISKDSDNQPLYVPHIHRVRDEGRLKHYGNEISSLPRIIITAMEEHRQFNQFLLEMIPETPKTVFEQISQSAVAVIKTNLNYRPGTAVLYSVPSPVNVANR